MTLHNQALGPHAVSLDTRVYANTGNAPLMNLLDPGCATCLDVGCGAGDNARLIKAQYPDCKVFGITRSAQEAKLARGDMEQCWVFDIEGEFPSELTKRLFDAIVFSHVLEHLREPSIVLERFSRLLKPGGVVLIAVPNILSWHLRIQFLFGRFEYESAGVLDDTHLRFFTYITADQYLLTHSSGLELQFKGVTGSVPLWWLRRYLFSSKWSEAFDRLGCRLLPNLFGGQVLIKVTKN